MPANIQVKTILNKTKRRDPWFLDDYTVNPYSSCSFNCLYCYIRGSKYGENLADKLSVKTNAPELLERQLSLRSKKGQFGIIVLSSATDPYLHFEKDTQLTRKLLEVIHEYRFPLHVITKSDLVLRDLDLLHHINEKAILPEDLKGRLRSAAFVTFSFSTFDPVIAGIFEPGATDPERRLAALKSVRASGLAAGVSMMPLLPYISDTREHLELMFQNFKSAGADYVFPSTLTLFGGNSSDSKTLVLRAVDKYFPHLSEKYHRFFDGSDGLPDYYQNAFYKKMKELSDHHGLKNSII